MPAAERFAAVVDGARGRAGADHAVVHVDHVGGQAAEGQGAAEGRRARQVGAGDAGRGVDRQRARGRPLEHLHARVEAVRRGGEVGVVGARAVLGVGLHRVAADAAVAVVVFLEVAGRLVEAVLVAEVMHDVVPVEQIHDGRFEVGAAVRLVGRIVGVVEGQGTGAGAGRPAAAGVVVVAVVLGEDVVAAGVGEVGRVVAVGVVPAEGRSDRIGRAR